MSEMGNYLRRMIPGDKEAKVTALTVTSTPQKFTSQLTSNYSRKRLHIYNNSDAASGECFYGYSGEISATRASMPIPVGEQRRIHVSEGIDVWLVAGTGQTLDIRVEEVA